MKKQDILTPIGLLVVVGVLFLGIAQGDTGISVFIDIPSFAITVGGSLAAILITFSLEDLKQIPSALKICMTSNNTYKMDLVDQFIELSRKVRKDGILAIEGDVAEIEDEFLKKGLELVIDGMEVESTREILENEISSVEKKYDMGSRMFKLWGSFAPAMGMVGTLIGLIQMLSGGLGNADVIASGMSKALITTFYGTLFANTLFNPIGFNIQTKGEKEVEFMEMMVAGIISIQNGESSTVIEGKLVTYLSDKERKTYYDRSGADGGGHDNAA